MGVNAESLALCARALAFDLERLNEMTSDKRQDLLRVVPNRIPIVAFQIAYLAMGLTIWQSGREASFHLDSLLLSHQGESKRIKITPIAAKTTKPLKKTGGFCFSFLTQGEALKNIRTAVQPPPNFVSI
jgi:hypothetical protein